MAYECVTNVLQMYYKCVTNVLQMCYECVTRSVLQKVSEADIPMLLFLLSLLIGCVFFVGLYDTPALVQDAKAATYHGR